MNQLHDMMVPPPDRSLQLVPDSMGTSSSRILPYVVSVCLALSWCKRCKFCDSQNWPLKSLRLPGSGWCIAVAIDDTFAVPVQRPRTLETLNGRVSMCSIRTQPQYTEQNYLRAPSFTTVHQLLRYFMDCCIIHFPTDLPFQHAYSRSRHGRTCCETSLMLETCKQCKYVLAGEGVAA